ncbi:MAG: MBL fold metallo-hydrolase [Chlamydiales bacterium]|nr:MBL fold metallo-hydrolase [Chlamydiales bacterium]
MLWHFGYYNDPYPPEPPPKEFTYPKPEVPFDATIPFVTWINHSSYLVKLDGKTFLTDPIWSDRCSPFNFIGPKRRHPPPIQISELPHIDYVIISHNHYDHLDKETVLQLSKLQPHIFWVVPHGVKKWIKRTLHTQNIVELDWWDEVDHEGTLFTAVPAQHFSGRGLFDRNRTVWMGVVVERKKRFYFAGDTGYNDFDFKEIGKHFGHMDLSLLPIGVYSPRRFMKSVHVNPEDTVRIHQDVQSQLSVGGHWWTFRLSCELIDRPPYDLFLALQEQELHPHSFRVLKPGETINW